MRHILDSPGPRERSILDKTWRTSNLFSVHSDRQNPRISALDRPIRYLERKVSRHLTEAVFHFTRAANLDDVCAFPQTIEVVRPSLHHLAALGQPLRLLYAARVRCQRFYSNIPGRYFCDFAVFSRLLWTSSDVPKRRAGAAKRYRALHMPQRTAQD